MAWLRKRLLPAAIVAAVTPLSSAYADIGDTPVIGGLFNSTEVLKIKSPRHCPTPRALLVT